MNGEIATERLIVQEVLLDDLASVAQAEDEVPEPVVAVGFHDMPQDDYRYLACLIDHRRSDLLKSYQPLVTRTSHFVFREHKLQTHKASAHGLKCKGHAVQLIARCPSRRDSRGTVVRHGGRGSARCRLTGDKHGGTDRCYVRAFDRPPMRRGGEPNNAAGCRSARPTLI